MLQFVRKHGSLSKFFAWNIVTIWSAEILSDWQQGNPLRSLSSYLNQKEFALIFSKSKQKASDKVMQKALKTSNRSKGHTNINDILWVQTIANCCKCKKAQPDKSSQTKQNHAYHNESRLCWCSWVTSPAGCVDIHRWQQPVCSHVFPSACPQATSCHSRTPVRWSPDVWKASQRPNSTM